jgi:hypothetical protein
MDMTRFDFIKTMIAGPLWFHSLFSLDLTEYVEQVIRFSKCKVSLMNGKEDTTPAIDGITDGMKLDWYEIDGQGKETLVGSGNSFTITKFNQYKELKAVLRYPKIKQTKAQQYANENPWDIYPGA